MIFSTCQHVLLMCLNFDINFVLQFNKLFNIDFKITCFSVMQRSKFCQPEYDLPNKCKIFQSFFQFLNFLLS